MAFFTKPDPKPERPQPPRVRRIVDHVIYDTAKAECIASHVKRRTASGLAFYSQEILYRSTQGNWFFVLGQRFHLDQQPEVFVQPVSAEQVVAWLAEYNEIELLERHFPGRTQYA